MEFKIGIATLVVLAIAVIVYRVRKNKKEIIEKPEAQGTVLPTPPRPK